mmetsp:Transcript_22794/g.49973  ORF Transcript_22794/g.49973 Transcript_22794/m.49973 type:complete len:226 (+) Transcript_22794:306-983(+)
MGLTIRLGVGLLVINKHGETRPPELPVGDRVQGPGVLTPTLELVVPASVHASSHGLLVTSEGLDKDHLKVGLGETEANPRSLEGKKSSQEGVQEELGPQVKARSQQDRHSKQDPSDAVIGRHHHDVGRSLRRSLNLVLLRKRHFRLHLHHFLLFVLRLSTGHHTAPEHGLRLAQIERTTAEAALHRNACDRGRRLLLQRGRGRATGKDGRAKGAHGRHFCSAVEL